MPPYTVFSAKQTRSMSKTKIIGAASGSPDLHLTSLNHQGCFVIVRRHGGAVAAMSMTPYSPFAAYRLWFISTAAFSASMLMVISALTVASTPAGMSMLLYSISSALSTA